MEGARLQQWVAAVECGVVAHGRYGRSYVYVGKRTTVEDIFTYQTCFAADMYAFEFATLLECGLRDCGEIVGERDRFHTAAIECTHADLGDVVGHGERGDAAIAEGIFANRLDRGRKGVVAILTEREPHYLGCVGIEENPVDAFEILIGCRHLDGGQRRATVGLSYRRG